MRRLLIRVGSCLGMLAFTLSCGSDEPTAPATKGISADASEAMMARVKDEDALSIEDMLDDALFQVSVETVSEESLREPLLAAVDALEHGQVGKAGPLIRRASNEAEALRDDDSADPDTLISWSVIERYFEEAELL